MSPRRRGFDLETEIQCSEFALDLLDAQIAAEQRLRWRELAPQLEALGFDVSNQPEPPMPHVLEQRSERLMRAYQRERFCLAHRRTKPPSPSHNRKYGWGHRQQRAAWWPRVAAGVVKCARCGELIDPRERWDLGHIDGTVAYSGPEHQSCNRATSSHRVGRDLGRRVSVDLTTSRAW